MREATGGALRAPPVVVVRRVGPSTDALRPPTGPPGRGTATDAGVGPSTDPLRPPTGPPARGTPPTPRWARLRTNFVRQRAHRAEGTPPTPRWACLRTTFVPQRAHRAERAPATLAPRAARPRLLHRQRALHPRLAVARYGAVIRVGLAGFERRLEGRDALGDDRALAEAVDGDVVRDARPVGHRDGHGARVAGRLGGGEGQLATRVGRDADGAVLLGGGPAAGGRHGGGQAAGVLARLGRHARDVGGDVVGVLAADELGRHLDARGVLEPVRVQDLLVDDPADRGLAEALLQRLLEGLVEVGPRRALGAGAGQRVARAALLDEHLLARDDVCLRVLHPSAGGQRRNGSDKGSAERHTRHDPLPHDRG